MAVEPRFGAFPVPRRRFFADNAFCDGAGKLANGDGTSR